MAIRTVTDRIKAFTSKYKYMILMVLVGIVLLLLPGTGKERTVNEPPQQTAVESQDLGQQLEEILSQIHGAGKVRVLLSVSAGEENIFQANTDQSKGVDSERIQMDTVIITDSNRSQAGLIRQVNPPIYQGAVVVCQGADDPSVRLALVGAVSRITGLGSDRISVLKMK